MRAWASGLRTKAASIRPGRSMSPTKLARPCRCRASSLRGSRAPMPVRVRSVHDIRSSLAIKSPAMPSLFAYQGAVTAGHPLAAQSGLRILMAGGNAVDAAVATAAALCVVMPDMNGPLGYGFALIAMAGEAQPTALDMHGTAPRGVEPHEFAAALGPITGARARTG